MLLKEWQKEEVKGRHVLSRKQLLDDLMEKDGYCNLREKALDPSLWRTHFVRGNGHVVSQTTEPMSCQHIWVRFISETSQSIYGISFIYFCGLYEILSILQTIWRWIKAINSTFCVGDEAEDGGRNVTWGQIVVWVLYWYSCLGGKENTSAICRNWKL
jgi:hypothetical protein